MSNCYDDLIKSAVKGYFSELLDVFGPDGWLWIKAQMAQESSFQPYAKSSSGAMGLMQLIPSTWEVFSQPGNNPFYPRDNISAGVRYMAYLYGRFDEIPDPVERIRITLACYNGGPGYPNVAIALAREAEGLPFGYRAWRKAGKVQGKWQEWDTWSHFLKDPRCKANGKNPDYRQVIDYVEKICAYHASYVEQGDA